MVYKPTALPLSYKCKSALDGNRTHDLQFVVNLVGDGEPMQANGTKLTLYH